MHILFLQADSIWYEMQRLEQLLGENLDRLNHIQSNTTLNFVDDGMNLLAVISLVIAIFALIIESVTWLGITGTKESIVTEAEKNRVDKECQYRLFQDIIRHLYRNKVCVLTMQVKLQQRRDSMAADVAAGRMGADVPMLYPSEEHILKLKLLPSDIHLEEYYRESVTYFKLHEIEILLRNYNTEIDSAFIHIPNPDIDDATKKRDFETLNFKTAFITLKIVGLMDEMWSTRNNLADARQIIFNEQARNAASNRLDEEVMALYAPYVSASVEKELKYDNVKKIFGGADMAVYKKGLTDDLFIECGTNERGEEKVHIIELHRR